MRNEDSPESLRQEINRYPTDLRLHFRLGLALCAQSDYAAAIPELRKAMNSPHDRFLAMTRLVEAYTGSGDLESAARMLAQVARESGGDNGAGSAPVSVPTRPHPPQGPRSARKRPHEDDPV